MANPVAPAPADLGAALQAHDEAKKSTHIPSFFGDGKNDKITANTLIDRINRAAQVARWDEARKCLELYLVLRGPVLEWYEGLQYDHIDTNNL